MLKMASPPVREDYRIFLSASRRETRSIAFGEIVTVFLLILVPP